MPHEFSIAVRQFVAEHVASVAQLEVLLLLRAARDRSWSAAEVATALYTAPVICGDQLVDLQARGLLVVAEGPEPRFRYQPRTPELSAVVDTLATLYAERRVAVITLIYSKPVDSVRSFADAFRLRKDK